MERSSGIDGKKSRTRSSPGVQTELGGGKAEEKLWKRWIEAETGSQLLNVL